MDLISETYLMDCMQGMKEYPDKYFDLAVVDPPYGIDIVDEFKKNVKSSSSMFNMSKGITGKSEWDKAIPTLEYFTELFRVSKNQIIWGGNYFIEYLGNTRCMIVWDKMNGTNPMADAELAWTSFTKSVKMFRMHHFSSGYDEKIHPTQKPVKLYDWIYQNFAEPGQRILDTHLGSGSNRIAAHKNGLHFVGFEIDEEYYYSQEARFKTYLSQPTLFSTPSAVGVLNTNASAQTDLWNTNSPQPL